MRFVGVLASAVAMCLLPVTLVSEQSDVSSAIITAKWDQVTATSTTIATTQILGHAYTLRSSPTHDPLFKALRDLHTDATRLQFWYSVTRQAVFEIMEPTATETYWDFTYADPLVADFYANTEGKRHFNATTIPRWMFNVEPKTVPEDPAASFYPYTDDTKGDLLKDPSGKQIAAYQARIFQWYTQGGFTDEVGKFHKSDHHYKVDYWDVLNEPDFENHITVEQYTRIYDAVTEAIHKLDPHVEFFGPEVSGAEVPWAKYFLDPKNHAPGSLPVSWFTFHNYVNATNDPDRWQEKYFLGPAKSDTDGASAKVFLDRIHQVIATRDQLSPTTKVSVDEMGTFDDIKTTEEACRAPEPYSAFNPRYWNAIGANWAYFFIVSEQLNMPLLSMSQMIGYPTQCPSISMFNKDTARPNAHYWVLKLIHSHFASGDRLVATESSSPDVVAQASITPTGKKLLLINTSNRTVSVSIAPSFAGGRVVTDTVDEATGEQPPRHQMLKGAEVSLTPFAVAVVSAR